MCNWWIMPIARIVMIGVTIEWSLKCCSALSVSWDVTPWRAFRLIHWRRCQQRGLCWWWTFRELNYFSSINWKIKLIEEKHTIACWWWWWWCVVGKPTLRHLLAGTGCEKERCCSCESPGLLHLATNYSSLYLHLAYIRLLHLATDYCNLYFFLSQPISICSIGSSSKHLHQAA